MAFDPSRPARYHVHVDRAHSRITFVLREGGAFYEPFNKRSPFDGHGFYDDSNDMWREIRKLVLGWGETIADYEVRQKVEFFDEVWLNAMKALPKNFKPMEPQKSGLDDGPKQPFDFTPSTWGLRA